MALVIGSKGSDVLALQKKINLANQGKAGYVPLVEDGIYGPKTDAANKMYSAPIISTVPAGSTQEQGMALAKLNTLNKPIAPVDPDAADKALARTYLPKTDLSGLNNLNLAPAPEAPAVYKSPYEDKINSLLDKYLNFQPVAVDQDALKVAQDNAMGAVNREAARRGMIYSDSNKAQLGLASMSLIPQFEEAAAAKTQSQLNSITNQLRELQGLSTTDYNRYRDTVSDTQAAKDKALKTQLDTIGQYSDNYQAEINRREATPDTADDELIPYIKTARQDKIAAQAAAQTAAEEKAAAAKTAAEKAAYDRAYDLWKTGGTVTNQAQADILGVPVGSKTADFNIDSINAATSQMNARTSAANAAKSASDVTTMGTPEQLQNYYSLLQTYTGTGGGLISMSIKAGSNDPVSLLIKNKGAIVSKIGTKLYDQLTKDVKTVVAQNKGETLTPAQKSTQVNDVYKQAMSMKNAVIKGSGKYDPKNPEADPLTGVTPDKRQYTDEDILNYINMQDWTKEEKNAMADSIGLPK